MARRSRSRGGAPAREQAHKHRDPNARAAKQARNSPEAALEAVFDRLGDAFQEGNAALVSEIMLRDLAVVHGSAPNVIVKRLVEDREKVPAVALTILRDVGRTKAPKYLRKVAEASEAPDATRLEARRILGWDKDENRISFLDSLTDGDAALLSMTERIAGTWPLRPYLVPEVVAYLTAMSSQRRQKMIARIVEEAGPPSIPVLHAILHFDDPSTQIMAIEALERFQFVGSMGPLHRLSRTAMNRDVRARSETALRDVNVTVSEVEPQDEDTVPFPMEDIGIPTEAIVSTLSFSGEQTMFVTRQMTDDVATGVGFALDDRAGIVDAFPLPPGLAEDVRQRILDTADQTSDIVNVPPAVLRGMFDRAIDLMAERGLPLSPEVEVWEPFLHESYPPPPDEDAIDPILDASGYAGRHDLVERGAALYRETDFFIAWGFDEEPTEKLMERVDLPPIHQWTDEHHRIVLEELATPEFLAGLPERLRRQAFLLDAVGLPEMKDIALAVAASIPGATTDDLVRNPFMREMASISIDWGMSPFFGLTDEEIEDEMEKIDPTELLNAFNDLGITPEDLFQMLQEDQSNSPSGSFLNAVTRHRGR